jgi:peptide-methionine (S)-S-oxide reductase
MLFSRHKSELVAADQALRGRDDYPFAVPTTHYVNGHPIRPPFTGAPEGMQLAIFGLGCFWGAEEVFWQLPGVWTTAVGYAGGHTPHPTYEEVCSGMTGHTEAVQVGYDPAVVGYERLLATFFEVHDPTQGMRQGNDVGTQYRSAVYYLDDAQRAVAERAKDLFSATLTELGYGTATTEIAPAGPFYYAEDYHQQYLAKVPNGYRCHATTGVRFPLDKLAVAG